MPSVPRVTAHCSRPPRGGRAISPARPTRDRCRARDNGFDEHDAARPHRRARRRRRAVRQNARSACSRGLTGRWPFALVLGLLAMAEVTIYADDIGAGDDRKSARNASAGPRAQARRLGDRSDRLRRPRWRSPPTEARLTIAALGGLVVVLYLFASTYGRRWSVLPALPFLVNAIEPFSGDDAGLSECPPPDGGRRCSRTWRLAPAAR